MVKPQFMVDELNRICVHQEFEILILSQVLKMSLSGESIGEEVREKIQGMIEAIENRTAPNHPSREIAEEWVELARDTDG